MKLSALWDTIYKQGALGPQKSYPIKANAVLTDAEMDELQADIEHTITHTGFQITPTQEMQIEGNPKMMKEKFGDVKILEKDFIRVYLYRGTETTVSIIQPEL